MLPSCADKEEALVKLKNMNITGSQEKMLIQLADTILPKTDFLGAADLKAHGFILLMVDDCYDPDRQKRFSAGMKEFDKAVRKKYGSSFTACTAAQKKEWLTEIERKKDVPEDLSFFYETTKRFTIQSFTSSKEFMTGVLKYNMVPGSNFKGCVAVNI